MLLGGELLCLGVPGCELSLLNDNKITASFDLRTRVQMQFETFKHYKLMKETNSSKASLTPPTLSEDIALAIWLENSIIQLPPGSAPSYHVFAKH